jgi:hypothetical protein
MAQDYFHYNLFATNALRLGSVTNAYGLIMVPDNFATNNIDSAVVKNHKNNLLLEL